MKTNSKTFKVEYTKKVGGIGVIVVKAQDEAQAYENARYQCHTGRDFRNATEVDNSEYIKPRKAGFQGSERA